MSEHIFIEPTMSSSASLEGALATEELSLRPARPTHAEVERRAFVDLARKLAGDPDRILQRVVETALELSYPASTAGVSLLTRRGGEPVFAWPAVAGRLAGDLSGVVTWKESPCAIAVARKEPVLLRKPERWTRRLLPVEAPVTEVLVVPFPLQEEKDPIGTVWVTAEDGDPPFDAEDRRLLSELAPLVEAGQQMREARSGLEDMRRLQEISTRLIREGDVQALLDEILDAAVEIMDAPMGNMQLLDSETGELALYSQRGFSPDFHKQFARVDGASQTACGLALARRQRVTDHDVRENDLYRGSDREATLAAGIRAVQSTPMTSRSGRVLGMLSTHWDRPHDPPAERLGLLDLLARQGADLIERARTEEALRTREQELREVNAQLERRVRDRTAELERQTEQLRHLAGQLTTAEQRQRRELAQTLHDHLQQLLAAARMKVDMAVGRSQDEEVAARLQEALEHLDQGIEETRTLTTELTPPGLYREGLVPTVEGMAERMEQQYGLRVEVRSEGVPGTISDDLRAFIFQAIRELTFNVVKHAESDRAWVELRGDPQAEWLTVLVVDDGKGCDPDAALKVEGDRFGLLSIRERLHGFGGEFDLSAGPGGGLRVTLRVPLAPPGLEGGDGSAGPGLVDEVAAEATRNADPSVQPGVRPALRVLLVEDHEIIREGLVRLLEDQPGIEVAGEAADGQLGIEAVREMRPDVVVMDISMPRLDGIDATRIIKRHWPEIRVVGLSVNDGGTTAAMMREAGAEAHLPKGGPAEDLVAAIQGAAVES